MGVADEWALLSEFPDDLGGFGLLGEDFPYIVFAASPGGTIEYCNGRWFEYTGQTRTSARTGGFAGGIYPADRQHLVDLWERALRSGAEDSAEVRCRRADGAYLWHRVSVRPCRDASESIVRWVGTITDITFERDVTDQLRRTNAEAGLLREVARHTPTLLFTADTRGRVTFANERWAAVIGCPHDALLGAGWESFIHPDDRERVASQWLAHVGKSEPYQSQWRLRRADETHRWIDVRAEAERNPGGRIVQWYGVAVDIDEQRRTFDALELLVKSGASIAREQDVTKILTHLASASLAGVADIAIFDLLDDAEGTRLVVASPEVPQEVVAAVREYGPPKRESEHPIAQAIARRASVVINDVDESFIVSNVADEARRNNWRVSGIRSLLCVPMLVSGKSIGALTLLRTRSANPFHGTDVRIFEDVAHRAASAIENIRLNEAARRESRDRSEQFRRIADLSPQFMWTTDASGNVDWWNKRWYEYSGQTVEESLGTGYSLLMHPEDLPGVLNAWKSAVASGKPFEREYRLRGSGNQYRWFVGRAVAEREVSGNVVKWYGSTNDIHESRRAALTMRVFADLGEALSETLGLEATLNAIINTVVPAYADWGYISLADTAGELRIAAAVHPHPREQAKLDTLLQKKLADGDSRLGSPEVLRTRTPVLVRRTSYAEAESYLRADVVRVFESVGFMSVLICPLLVGAESRGTLVFCMSESGQPFDPDDMPFFQELARRVAPAIANAELYERERRVAQSFQEAALPSKLPSCDGFEFDAIYEAGLAEALVGGDWYDAFVLLDGRIVISIGDVAGSGLEAAVIMANMRQAIRGVAQVHADPDLMLEAADRALRSENPDRFVTAFVGVIDPVEKAIAYQSAGHPPPLLCTSDGECAELTSSGLPLGLRTDDEPATKFAHLSEGALLVLYTDGLIESTHDLFEGERRLRSVLADPGLRRGLHPAKQIHDAVLTEGSRDDVAILTIRTGARAEPLHWTVDTRDDHATGSARLEIVRALRKRGMTGTPLAAAELILAEFIANITRYTPGAAELLLEWNGLVPVLHALDSGPGFEFAAKLPQDLYSESGRGLFLIAKLSLDFTVMRRPEGGSHARVVLKT